MQAARLLVFHDAINSKQKMHFFQVVNLLHFWCCANPRKYFDSDKAVKNIVTREKSTPTDLKRKFLLPLLQTGQFKFFNAQ